MSQPLPPPVSGPTDVRQIFNILPHRYPFLLVDKVIDVQRVKNGNSHVGSTIRAVKNVTFNEPHFTGHFPENPIMPGVLIIEALAQASAFLAYQPHPEGRMWQYYILGVDKARFRKTVVPGDQLILEARTIKDRGTLIVFACEAKVNGDVVAEAEIMAKML